VTFGSCKLASQHFFALEWGVFIFYTSIIIPLMNLICQIKICTKKVEKWRVIAVRKPDLFGFSEFLCAPIPQKGSNSTSGVAGNSQCGSLGAKPLAAGGHWGSESEARWFTGNNRHRIIATESQSKNFFSKLLMYWYPGGDLKFVKVCKPPIFGNSRITTGRETKLVSNDSEYLVFIWLQSNY